MVSGRNAPVTSVQQAREALGGRLREVRRRSGLTGAVLAERLNWPHSKVSKLENGRQTPSDADVRAWCSACPPIGETEVEGLLAALHTLEARHAEWRRLLRGGAHGHQDTLTRLYAKARTIHNFECNVVPGLLQTSEYARAVLTEVITSLGLANDVDDAVAARLARQQIIYSPGRRFHFVITEAVLRYRFAPPPVMLAQLDRLISATTLPNLRFGVIGFGTAYPRIPDHGFWLFDDRLVQVETLSAELNLMQPDEIRAYTTAFRQFASIAFYGEQARAVIAASADALRCEIS